ncbi:Mariner Mos1 transposase [Eumeta japonica]|uniref:Mariner Mos1 transposase n=1 Tax=Eumeta variegata TaxID=151549 RepID=A0A4C1ZU52_EUMVA|nr:Mariner Mos1 transposase [Eumeta japonica]
MTNQTEGSKELRHVAEAHRLLVAAYNEAALSERTCREWFQKFKNGDFDEEDKDRSGRPKIYEDAELEELLGEESSQTQKELALTLEVTQQLGVVYYKLLNPNETITGTVYRTVDEFESSSEGKTLQCYSRHDKIILLDSNSRPRVTVPMKNYLKTLDWEVLPHPPYSTDIAPSDCHLFRSMAHALSEQRFTSYEHTKNWVDSWIASKDKEFFRLEIRTLA